MRILVVEGEAEEADRAKGERKMRYMTRREAVGTLITGGVVAALIDLTQGGKTMAEEAQQSGGTPPQLPPAYRGAN